MIMTAQEILNTVAQHLIKQGRKSLRPDAYDDPDDLDGDGCAYLSKDGLKCAVGCLLEEGEYYPEMESKNVDGLRDLLPGRLRGHTDLLTSLQLIHDAHPVADWPRQLRELSESQGLNVPEGC